MPNYDEGGEHTINHMEFDKIESEQRIRNSESFYELLTTLKDLQTITGSDGKTEFSYEELTSRLAKLFEQFQTNQELQTNLLTSNFGLKDTFKRLLNEYKKEGEKLVADQFIVACGENHLPIKDFPQRPEEWFAKDNGSKLLECTILGVKDLTRDKYMHYYGTSPRSGYLDNILHRIKVAQQHENHHR